MLQHVGMYYACDASSCPFVISYGHKMYNVNVHYDTVKITICLCYYMLLLPRAMT